MGKVTIYVHCDGMKQPGIQREIKGCWGALGSGWRVAWRADRNKVTEGLSS